MQLNNDVGEYPEYLMGRWSHEGPRPDRPGLVAVSANFLHGYPYATYAKGRIVPIPPDAFTWIGRHPRVADLGGGIFVYRIGP